MKTVVFYRCQPKLGFSQLRIYLDLIVAKNKRVKRVILLYNKTILGGDFGFDRKYEFLGACRVAEARKKAV